MKLIEVTNALKAIALAQPAIRSVIPNDVYRLNSVPNVSYGVFSFVQGTHRNDDADLIRFAFTLFYVDRLTEAKDNEIEVQSTGIEVLRNIIKGFENTYCDGEHQMVSFVTFTERFSDECAGAFASVEFNVPVDSICEETY